jgi:hypothetical protein
MNTLQDLINSGDRDALNAFLAQQTISGDSQGISLNGKRNVSLSDLIRPPAIQQPANQYPQTGRNVGFSGLQGQMVNEGADQSWTPQSRPITNETIGALPEVQQYRREQQAVAQYQARQAAAERENNPLGFSQPRTQAERMQQLFLTQKYRDGEQKLKPESKLQFSETQGGFVEPPSQQFPNGRLIPVEGMKSKNAADKVPMGYQVQPDGTLKAWQGGPADIKEQAKSSAQETGRENVSQTIAALRDAYGQLKEGGGITDPSASGVSNLTAGMASSGLGQATGRMFGTQNQSKRNEILMTRPALLQHIMKATGMSAKQMDSNAELKLWLSTATDPTLDISANMNALDRIEQTYGLGGQPKPSNTASGNGYDAGKEARYQAWKAQQGAR